MKATFPTNKFKDIETPFYYYDTPILRDTLELAEKESSKYGYHIHYAVKANANPRILTIIREYGLGADCVSGGEIQAALSAGFPADKIVFAGVGKADWEINLGLDNNIFCFNAESIPEVKVIDELAGSRGKTARIALRINPEIDAHTHHYITTGLKENKFGINLSQLDDVLDVVSSLSHIRLIGIHFHIGSQITDLTAFQAACSRMTEVQEHFTKRNIFVENINFGGGLGIDYRHPDRQIVPDFASYFAIFNKHFNAMPGQTLHFEPGRSIVGQCGSLISKVLYVKEGSSKKFAILDAGFTELIRPALYGAFHKIENISSDEAADVYDVVGPICESSDCFGKDVELNKVSRGNLVALRSAGAYGEIMASRYNCRKLPKAYFSDLI
ncbi:MAG: diaminopimelate decarboxylase [Dysgonamonadaceae bacterium]|jgi:diaminopimelate decarboxylase|nr:diaminopimelate decarboxylase [Dysgonamonadaceae bacterium]